MSKTAEPVWERNFNEPTWCSECDRMVEWVEEKTQQCKQCWNKVTSHIPTSFLNQSDEGIRTVVGCSCGWMPNQASKTGTARGNAFKRHAASYGVTYQFIDDVVGAGIGKGTTHNQWLNLNGWNCDPYADSHSTDCICSEVTA